MINGITIAFQSSSRTTRESVFVYDRMTFCLCDRDLEAMTLIHEFDLDILKM